MARTKPAEHHAEPPKPSAKPIVPKLEQTTLHLHAISTCSLYCVIRIKFMPDCFQSKRWFRLLLLLLSQNVIFGQMTEKKVNQLQYEDTLQSGQMRIPSNIRNQSHKFIELACVCVQAYNFCCRGRSIIAIVFQIKRLRTITV